MKVVFLEYTYYYSLVFMEKKKCYLLGGSFLEGMVIWGINDIILKLMKARFKVNMEEISGPKSLQN